VASPQRAIWRRLKTSLAHQVSAEVAPALDEKTAELRARLDAVEAQLATLSEQVRDLRQIAGTQVDVTNESTELLGRLIRSASSRIDELEERASREL
jgi:ABC-type transporter Mla subunit MlaD